MIRALARVDLGAIERNTARMAAAAPGAVLCAVVKADAYGHGMVPAARAALAGGAAWLAVATAMEAAELRAAGISGRVLVLGALSDEELPIALGAGADVVAWHEETVARVGAQGGGRVHVKLDTGMGRLGTRDPALATAVADAAAQTPGVELAGLMTHFATADDPGDTFFGEQRDRFAAWARPLAERHPGVLLHAANSAATLRDPASHFDLVRPGVALYGLDPFGLDPSGRGLEPALELTSYLAAVKPIAPGESAGYGRRFVAQEPTLIATVPIGYGDGWRRGLTNDADVLVAGRRVPLVGTVSMDNVTLDVGALGRGGLRRHRGGPDRRARDGAHPHRGARAPARHDQLRGDLRHRRAGPARARRGGVSASETPLDLLRGALAGREAWLVGGAVRDRLLGRPGAGLDLDLAVAGDVAAAAAAVRAAAPRGTAAFPLSEEFGGWRVIGPAGAWQVDLSPLQGERIEDDLRGRDLTVNALAEPLRRGDPLDVCGGLRDLAARRLRSAGPRAFADDPLRVLRVARLAVDLGFTVEDGTVTAAREQAPGLAGVAGERVFAELRRIVGADDALAGLALLDELGATAVVLPEFEALRGVEQTVYHHRDVHGHTLEVLAATLALERDPESAVGAELAGAVAALLAEPLADDLTRGGALRWGALLHDIAKPLTRTDMGEGRIGFPHHDREGAAMSRVILGRLHTSERLRAHVAALARHHLRLGFLVHERPLGRRQVHRYLVACEPVAADVTLLGIADRLATRGRKHEEAIARHLEVALPMLGDALAWHADGPPAPLVRGDELAEALGIEPGPRLGELLAAIAEAQYAGEVLTPAQAVDEGRRLLLGDAGL